ncbi:MAG: protein-glutamate O-methyltransferase CheR [Leptospirales bacterium]|nr:protein-glutamate O-methyltransferase CheR [Leptospirales bacterium]
MAADDLSLELFKKFAEIIHREASITLREHKLVLLSNRLRRRLRATGVATFEAYLDYLQSNDSEMRYFLEVVTTNESYFWRTTANFDLLKKDILPALLAQFPGQELRFWSAGCSTGEEPYNLAMELTEAMKTCGIFKYSILATDISASVIAFAREGQYTGRKIEKIPPVLLYRYFRPVVDKPDHFEVRPDIKAKINFRVGNLFTEENRGIHMIFCRNVMIYFGRPEQEIVIRRFYDSLYPGGWLIIGYSESLHMIDTQFKGVHFPDGVAYKKNGAT